jgi:hypothetical protein
MLERWNIGFQKDISHFNFIVNPAGGGNINPALHCPFRAVGWNSLLDYFIALSFIASRLAKQTNLKV